jgi:hypothetical protein
LTIVIIDGRLYLARVVSSFVDVLSVAPLPSLSSSLMPSMPMKNRRRLHLLMKRRPSRHDSAWLCAQHGVNYVNIHGQYIRRKGSNDGIYGAPVLPSVHYQFMTFTMYNCTSTRPWSTKIHALYMHHRRPFQHQSFITTTSSTSLLQRFVLFAPLYFFSDETNSENDWFRSKV